MKTKKTATVTNESANESNVEAVETVPVLPPGNPVPSSRAPNPPPGWKARKLGRAGVRALASQIDNAPTAAKELRSAASYEADFGPKAPERDALARTIEAASQWRDQWAAAQRWCQYASEQRALWEAAMLKEAEELRPLFDYANARDPDVGKHYPSLKQFFGAQSARGLRAARTRKNRLIEQKKVQTTPKAPPAPEPPPGNEVPPQVH